MSENLMNGIFKKFNVIDEKNYSICFNFECNKISKLIYKLLYNSIQCSFKNNKRIFIYFPNFNYKQFVEVYLVS